MAKRMLIDASHPEETRVVVANGTRLEEFDFESAARKQLKGNVYLAKVMRVEPSLQAAFVDYGGNRHGFLPLNEIHPDYYQIPVADREALYAEQESAAQERHPVSATRADDGAAAPRAEPGAGEPEAAEAGAPEPDAPADDAPEDGPPPGDGVPPGDSAAPEDAAAPDSADAAKNENGADAPSGGDVEDLGGDEMDDQERRRLQASRDLLGRRYHIQEVIKKRQIMLVQVVKEERGNKGAALTTYLSLAGRYMVLMPNAIRGGGISRKIVNAEDRRRLKTIVKDLAIPPRMAAIVRTAGLSRSRAELKRDLEYLLRRWQGIRELTLQSTAPCVINEEANLIRRSIRDLYARDIEQILIEGDEGYRTAKSFMKLLIPSHTAKVQPYRDRIPLFVRYQIESQLDSMYSPEIPLKSGGYLVIDPTEALVAIDVNSGRATRERSVEETALKTNLEASEEVARQLRLRDLAGLIVVDFIDMDENRNQRAVERKLKEAMRNDRARIRIGRISAFGLLELSRQRLRPSLQEASMERCAGCGGTGVRRSVESSAVHALRAIEEEGLQGRSAEIAVRMPALVALYLLNRKRQALAEIEQRYDFTVRFQQDDALVPPNYAIERIQARSGPSDAPPASGDAEAETPKAETAEAAPAEPGRKRRRRRRKPRSETTEETAAPPERPAGAEDAEDGKDDDSRTAAKRRRRGRRGGRRRTTKPREEAPEETSVPDAPLAESREETSEETPAPAAPPAKSREEASEETSAPAAAPAESREEASEETPAPDAPPAPPLPSADEGAPATAAEGEAPPRRGWWQRLGSNLA